MKKTEREADGLAINHERWYSDEMKVRAAAASHSRRPRIRDDRVNKALRSSGEGMNVCVWCTCSVCIKAVPS